MLMRLKLGLFLNDLADRFGISQGHASKIFTTWINFLFHELPPLFPFPSQERITRGPIIGGLEAAKPCKNQPKAAIRNKS